MNKELLGKVIDLIYKSILAEGGDGNALWYTKFVTIDTLLEMIKKYNEENNTGWEVTRGDNYLSWGTNMEWATITDDKEFYYSQAHWIILKIEY